MIVPELLLAQTVNTFSRIYSSSVWSGGIILPMHATCLAKDVSTASHQIEPLATNRLWSSGTKSSTISANVPGYRAYDRSVKNLSSKMIRQIVVGNALKPSTSASSTQRCIASATVVGDPTTSILIINQFCKRTNRENNTLWDQDPPTWSDP